jgi:hypothetical protein
MSLPSADTEIFSLEICDLSALHTDSDLDQYLCSTGCVNPTSQYEDDSTDSTAMLTDFMSDLDDDDLVIISQLDSDFPSDGDPTVYSDDFGLFDDGHILRRLASIMPLEDDSPLYPRMHRPPRSPSPPELTPELEAEYYNYAQNLRGPGLNVYALHALDPMLRTQQTTRSKFYEHFHVHQVSPDGDIRAHMDGGSQTNTTSDLSILWHVEDFSPTRKVPTLKVADETPHRPTAAGYVRLPSGNADGFEMIPCFYTPSLPATILSPDRIGKGKGCCGYSVHSSFVSGRDCLLKLHGCQRRSQDIVIRLESIRGLLHTEPLIKPTTAEERTGPLPRRALKVCRVTSPGPASFTFPSALDDALADDDDDASVHSDFPANDCHDSCPCRNTVQPVLSPEAGEGDNFYCHTVGSPVPSPTPPSEPPSRLSPIPSIINWFTGSPSPSPDSAPAPSVPSSSPSAVPPLDTSVPVLDSSSPPQYMLHSLTRDQLRLLWHQRLAHLNFRRTSALHKFVKGVPELPTTDPAELCPVCASAKLHRHAHGTGDSRRATVCNQGISVDFSFIVQKSSNAERLHRLTGLNGETCYVLITDHHSGNLYGATFSSKHPPLAFINRWLTTHGCSRDTPDKYVRMDLGGELGRSPKVHALFTQAGYSVEPTAPDSSHQNGPVERSNRDVGNAIRVLLGGAQLDARFWPYAFHHYLRLHNVTPHGKRE